jgi:RNA polymerase sigma-70 factor, ECF subfamily
MPSIIPDPPSPGPDEVTDSGLIQAVQLYLERHLLGEAQGGSTEAWERFYSLYGPMIRRFALACHVPPGDVDDCIQDVFKTVITVLRDLKYDRDQGRFRGWLFSVVRSRTTDLVRRRMRRGAERLSGEQSAELLDPGSDPAAEVDRRWQREVVRTVLLQLKDQVSPRNFDAFYLRAIKGLSVTEIAAELGTTPEKVRYRHHRMLRKFGELYVVYTGEKHPQLG